MTPAVVDVLGASNPAGPFLVAGIKIVLDEQTPAIRRFAHDHADLTAGGALVAVIGSWRGLDARRDEEDRATPRTTLSDGGMTDPSVCTGLIHASSAQPAVGQPLALEGQSAAVGRAQPRD